MSSKAGEISSIIKEQIKQYETKIEMKENGTVITVGDGIATVYGLRSCMANELLRFRKAAPCTVPAKPCPFRWVKTCWAG